MARKPASIATWAGTKLLFAGAAVALAYSLPDLPAGKPAPPAAAPHQASPLVKAAMAATRRPAFVIDSALAPDHPLRHGDYAWSDEGVPAGRLWIHVDLARQTIRVIRGTTEIGRAVILYGAPDKPTPLGTFRITEKDADHVSNLYDGEMPYMLRLTNDGVAIHGSNVRYGWATNGCIGVPEEFAALLFAQAKLGDRVVITGGTV